jgi:hypothetical protein
MGMGPCPGYSEVMVFWSILMERRVVGGCSGSNGCVLSFHYEACLSWGNLIFIEGGKKNDVSNVDSDYDDVVSGWSVLPGYG